jgi:uncharacterized protein (TIGR02099 family)
MSWLLRKAILIIFWGGVTFTALLAVFALSVSHLLPYLDNYRPKIESNLEQITGYPISLGRIDGRLEGVDPTISISDFQLLVNEQPSIAIDEMRIRLDTVKSLLSLSLQFTYIRFVEPVVDLQESEGQWRLNGARPSRTVRNDVGFERVLDYLSAQRNFSILNASVKVHSDQFGEHLIEIPHLYIFQKAFGSLLSSTFYLDNDESPFQINARLDGYSGLLGNYHIKASLKTPMVSLPLKDMLSSSTNPYSLKSIETGGDFWFDIIVDKEIEIRAESARFNVSFSDGQEYQTTSSVRLRYVQKSPSLHLDVRNLRLEDQIGKRYPATNLAFDWSSLTKRSSIAFDQVDLGVSHQIASHFLSDNLDVKNILDGLEPIGMARNGSVQVWRDNEALSFQFLSNIQSASVNGYNGIPKATNINAVFSLSEDSGYIDFRGKGSEVYFDTVYDESWATDSLSGHVGWQKQQDAFVLIGKNLSVDRNHAQLSGNFRLEIRENEADWISLDLHGRDISTLDRLSYIPPNALNEDLKSWINLAFSDVGQVNSVDVLLQSELLNDAKPHVRVKMHASDLEVKFDENWPVANKVKGTFEFDDNGVSVLVDSATLLDLVVSDLLLTVPIRDDSADWLNLKGQVGDDASVVMAMLKETPLAETVLQPFESWVVDGGVQGEFEIGIPLVEGNEPKVRLGLDFENNALLLQDLNLSSVIQRGHLNYSSENGITDSEFDIQSLGGLSHLILSSSVMPNGELAVFGALSGTADLRKLAEWREAPESLINNLSGEANYTGELSVNQSQNGQVDLVIDSDLVGVSINLPEPVGKVAQDSTPFKIRVMQHEDDLVIDAKYKALSDARFLIHNGEFVGGEVIMSAGKDQPLSSVIPNGLVLTGDFDSFDVQEWLSVLESTSNKEHSSLKAEIPKIPQWINKIDLIVDNMIINPHNTLHNFKATYDALESESLFVSSDEVNFAFTDKNGTPDLHFGFLSWNTETAEESTEVVEKKPTEAPISAQQVPNMTLSVDQFYLNEQPYGDWQFSIKSEGNKVSIDPITSILKTGTFTGSFVWLDAGEDSSVELAIASSGKDLSELAGKFSNEGYISSKKYNIDVDLNWKGHPFYFDRESVSGGIRFSAENGNFHKVDELPSFLKALGIFNIGALSRRLLLDFSDVYEPGLTYDDFTGALTLNKGILKTVKPITIIAPSAELVIEGEANIVDETLNERLTATFPLSGALPLAGLLWATPQIAGLLFITDKLIGDQLSKVTSVQYQVEGSFNNPVMTPVKFKPIGKK